MDFVSKNYEINGVPASDTYRVYSVYSYGDVINLETPESEEVVRQKLVSHFKDGFGATDINILHTQFDRQVQYFEKK